MGDAISGVYGEGFSAQIYQYHSDLAAVVGIYSPRGINDGYPMFQSQAASRPNLPLEAYGYLKRQSSGDQLVLASLEAQGLGQGGVQVHSGRMRRCVLWQSGQRG